MSSQLSVYLEQEILSAGKLQLVHLLYQCAITEIREARRSMAAQRIQEKCLNINKACAIVTELRGSLNHEEGGDIAIRLGALYDYILSRLLHANLNKLDEPLSEVISLLSTLDEGWRELALNEESSREPSPSIEMSASIFSSNEMGGTAVHSWSL